MTAGGGQGETRMERSVCVRKQCLTAKDQKSCVQQSLEEKQGRQIDHLFHRRQQGMQVLTVPALG